MTGDPNAAGGAAAGGPDSLLGRITPARTITVVAFAIVFAIAAGLRLDGDVWWHLRAGQFTLHHWVIRHDAFSFTKAGAAWIDHSWGAEVIEELVWRAGGWVGLGLLTGALAVAGAWFVFRMSSGGPYLRAFALVLASWTASVFWSPRPQMFSYALTGAFLYVLWLRRHARVDRLWLLPPLMLVWANLHAGFVIGFLLMGCVLAGEAVENVHPRDDRGHLDWTAIRKLGLVAAASVPAACVNPYGPRLLAVPFTTAGSAYARLIDEWKPPTLHNAAFWPFAAMLVAFVVAVTASRHRVGWSDGILCVAVTLLALTAGRNVAVFAIVVTPVLTYHLATALDDRGWTVRPLERAPRPLALLNVAVIALVVAVAAARVLEPLDHDRLRAAKRRELPLGAVEFLGAQPVGGRLFNQYEWGGYVIHALPRVPVFVDGRSDLYGDAFLTRTYLPTIDAAPGWAQRLDDYRVDTVLVRSDSMLAGALRDDRRWRIAYHDALATVFQPREPAG